MPGYYEVKAEMGDFLIRDDTIAIFSGNNYYNISKAKPASIEGSVYYDSNGNGKYDVGEELSDAKVDIIYKKLADDGTTILKNITVSTTQTNGNGHYSLTSLVPGEYSLDVTKFNTATGYPNYNAKKDVTLEENKTTSLNISINLATVTFNGYTKYGNENIGDISVQLLPNKNIKNNTAVENTLTSNGTGYYQVELVPGYYNISAAKTTGETIVYSGTGQLEVYMGEGTITTDIVMTKVSATVSGSTKYNGNKVENITIDFKPDTAVKNNTAKFTITTKSDKNGLYEVELAPGSYIASVNETIYEAGQNVTYTFTDKLEIKTTDLNKSFDIALEIKVES